MTECEKIESRIRQVLLLEKAKTAHRINTELSLNLENLLANYFKLSGPPILNVEAQKNDQFKILIEAHATRIYK